MGPCSIREHSLRFAASDPGFHDPETGRTSLAHEMMNRTIADVGDVCRQPRWERHREARAAARGR